jgi:hypothetical protein
MVRVAGGALVWAAALFTTAALGVVGTWALAVAAIGFTVAAVLLVTALDDGTDRRTADDDVPVLKPTS